MKRAKNISNDINDPASKNPKRNACETNGLHLYASNTDISTSGVIVGTFDVLPIEQFSGRAPYYRQPSEVGYFSLDCNRRFHNDKRQLRYFKNVQAAGLCLDLRKGYENCILRDESVKERLDHLLMWVIENKSKFALREDDGKCSPSGNLNTDFVSWRGHLTKLLTTPYENRDPWQMAATRYKGTVFLSEVETEKARLERIQRTDLDAERCYWGYKFEEYVTVPAQDQTESVESRLVNTNEAYCSVIRTRLKGNSVVMGAEVDCCLRPDKRADQCAPPKHYIELKTTRHMNNYRQEQNYARFKLLKFWAQSFLAGIPRIVVGYRNDDGIVNELKTLNTLELPSFCRQYSRHWDASICLNFLERLLDWMKTVVVKDDANSVYMFYFNHPFDKISALLIEDGSARFLPTWFTEADKQV